MQLSTCGDVPILTSALTAIPNAPTTPPTVRLQWNPSVDEAAGERDITGYNVYFRVTGQLTWQPFMTFPAGLAFYDKPGLSNGALVAGTFYDYAVAAVDCSPAESGVITVSNVLVSP
jgi:hypothetical protein